MVSDMSKKSILERINKFKEYMEEEISMSVGDGGYTGSAPPEGPVAGYDPLIKFLKRRKKKVNDKTKE